MNLGNITYKFPVNKHGKTPKLKAYGGSALFAPIHEGAAKCSQYPPDHNVK